MPAGHRLRLHIPSTSRSHCSGLSAQEDEGVGEVVTQVTVITACRVERAVMKFVTSLTAAFLTDTEVSEVPCLKCVDFWRLLGGCAPTDQTNSIVFKSLLYSSVNSR